MISEELSKLKTLYDEGALSEDEYIAAKAQLLKQDSPIANANLPLTQPLFGITANQYAMCMHLSLYAITSGFGVIIPIVLWYHSKGYREFIDDHQKSIGNFLCSYAIYLSAWFILYLFIFFIWINSMLVRSIPADNNQMTFWIILQLLLYIPVLFAAILPLFGAIAAYKNKTFHYPLTIRFLR
jgi:uncharacterized Tic20 family protein